MLHVAMAVFALAAHPTARPAASPVYQITADSICRHVAVLADDSLEGRQIGEPGEWKAARYICGVLRASGIPAVGDSLDAAGQPTYFQPFEFTKAVELGPNNRLSINSAQLRLGEEFTPLAQSANAAFSFPELVSVGYGITVDSIDGDYDDYAGTDVTGKAVLVKRYYPRTDSARFDFLRYAFPADKINNALRHGAAAVVFVTPTGYDDTLTAIGPTPAAVKGIPILYVHRAALERLGLNPDDPRILSMAGQTELIKTTDTGYNAVGLLRGESDTAVIIGAHYDHLGWGGGTSRYHGPEQQIHNGADDNASGVAALLELARHFAARPQSHYSIVFIAFSGEEEGILGSSYFARHMTVDSTRIRMMINMDMIGRLRDQEGLIVFGTGSAAEFKPYFDSLKLDGLKIIAHGGGIGASDHTAFYNRHIPVLFFFTGAHADYHMPTDDYDKIDCNGIVDVAGLVAAIVDHFDQARSPLTYCSKEGMGREPSKAAYSVTLGVTPDFAAEVKGLRVDAVSPDRPAARAGIVTGDIIIRLGTMAVGDIYEYMAALGRFKKGDSTVVVVARGADTLSLPVVFE